MKTNPAELFPPTDGVASKKPRRGRPCLPTGYVRVRVVVHENELKLIVEASKKSSPRKSIPMVGGIFLSRGLCAAGGAL